MHVEPGCRLQPPVITRKLWVSTSRFARRKAVLVAAALITAGVCDGRAQSLPAEPRLIINEFLAAPSEGMPEFVELLNAGDAPIPLMDLELEDARHIPGSVVDAAGTETVDSLAPGAFIVLTSDVDELKGRFGPLQAIQIRPWPTLNNGGDLVSVMLSGQMIDELQYVGDWITPGVSLERINPHAPTRSASNWTASAAERGATPGAKNSVFEHDTTAPYVLAAEYAASRLIELTFSEAVDPRSVFASSFRLDGASAVSLEFTSSYDMARLLVEPDGRVLELLHLKDFSGNTSGPFVLEVAQRPTEGSLLISEILFDPGASEHDEERPEFIEITNRSQYPASLAGILMSIGFPEAPDLIIPLRPYGRVLAPGASTVVFAEPDPARLTDPYVRSSLLDTYPFLLNAADVVLVPVPGKSLGLNNDSDTVVLGSVFGTILDTVTYSDEWRDRRFSSHAGRSLERVSDIGSGPYDWATHAGASGSTPGVHDPPLDVVPDPAPGQLLLTEIMFAPVKDPSDGRADQVEFLEFVNTSGSTVDLNGLYLLSGPADRPLSDSLRLVYRPVPLMPDQVAVSFELPANVEDGDAAARGAITEAFPDAVLDESVVLLPFRGSLGLSNAGEHIQVRSAHGVLLEEMAYTPDWHHFLVVDGTGASLERIRRDGWTNDPASWTTSISVSGASPGYVPDRSEALSQEGRRVQIDVSPKTFSPNLDGVEDVARISIRLDTDVASGRLSIFDLSGRLVKHFPERLLSGANLTFYWFGDDDAGRRAPPGIYVLLAEISVANVSRPTRLKTPVALVR